MPLGVKVWLLRVFVKSKNPKSKVGWHFHDFVEFEYEGVLMTLAFGNSSLPNKYSFSIFEGSIDRMYNLKGNTITFRGADSRQIWGE